MMCRIMLMKRPRTYQSMIIATQKKSLRNYYVCYKSLMHMLTETTLKDQIPIEQQQLDDDLIMEWPKVKIYQDIGVL